MAETGIVRFPGSLDPKAKEFTPRNQNIYPPPPQIFYPCLPATGVHLHPIMPFCNNASPLTVPFPPSFSSPAAYGAPTAPPSPSPSRSIMISSLPAAEVAVSESMIRRELEVFGDVRGVQMERVREGIVTVHFYDLRHAEMALMAIRMQHMQQQTRLRDFYTEGFMKWRNSPLMEAAPLPPPARGLIAGRAVWAQFVVPAHNLFPQGQNQGTIVIFNLDSEISPETLTQMFEAFGPVRELRETPSKKNQKFVEFFDVRDASKALTAMNGKEINGKPIVIEFSRPGGHCRKFFQNAMPFNTQPPPPPPPPPSSPPISNQNARRFAHLPPPQLPSRKPAGNKGNNNNNSNNVEDAVSLETTATGLTNLSVVVQQEKKCEGAIAPKQQQGRCRNWKGKNHHQGKKQETRFLIKEDAIVDSSCKDSRTTVMIKNIPNKYSQKLLLNMLDNHCIHCNEQIGEGNDQPLSSYDFVYLPIDFNNKCNVGYGFVNMTSPEATIRLYKAFHLQHWEVFNSRKICQVTYARVQGLEALKEHFKNSKFPCEVDHYLPVVFSPPRDGRQVTEPIPIVGQKQHGEAAVDDGGDQKKDMQSSRRRSGENGGGEGDNDDGDDDDDRGRRRSEGAEEMGRD